MLQKRTFFLLGGLIVLIYLLILQRYGTAIPAPIPPEEINFAGLARNIAEGKGPIFAIPSELVPNPTLNPRRVYTPVLSYAFALSGWGKIWGFDLLPLRWFNRILGALNLLLLIGLARRWGVPHKLALLTALWTSMDIVYQLTSNLVRSDVFSLLGILLGLWTFTNGLERGEYKWWLTSGLCFAVALFAHFWQAFYLIAWLTLTLLWDRRRKESLLFFIPSTIASLLWLLFALQDWEWFLSLSRLMAQDKLPMSPLIFLVRLLGIYTFKSILGIYPSNSPIWIAVLLTLTWAKVRRHITAPLWQLGTFWIAYVTASQNPHPWYIGWFTPLGYLAIALFGTQVLLPWARRQAMPFVVGLALLWSGYQIVQVGRCWQAAPSIQQAHQAFYQELAGELPPGGSFWLRSVPDPSFFLYESRPDITLYVGTGYFTSPNLFNQLDGMIHVVDGWISLSELPPYHIRREWVLPGVIAKYPVIWTEPIR